jgi:hypothetical protein
MIGLLYLIAATAYLSLMIGAMTFAYRRAKGNGLSTRTARKHAGIAFLVVYLPMFWDLIPIIVAHQSFCMAKHRLDVKVDQDKWLQANAGLELKISRSEQDAMQRTQLADGWSGYMINRYIAIDRRDKALFPGVLHIKQYEFRAVDVRTEETLVESTDIRVGKLPKLGDRPKPYFPSCGKYGIGGEFRMSVLRLHALEQR